LDRLLAEAGSREKHQEGSFTQESQCKSDHQIILAESNNLNFGDLFGRAQYVYGSRIFLKSKTLVIVKCSPNSHPYPYIPPQPYQYNVCLNHAYFDEFRAQ
jgi:hypothetical protein